MINFVPDRLGGSGVLSVGRSVSPRLVGRRIRSLTSARLLESSCCRVRQSASDRSLDSVLFCPTLGSVAVARGFVSDVVSRGETRLNLGD
ncbi:hypothetical protein AArcMg_3507 [Natrarchaeobaculum sulfurireducens]|uniref:Uncharacterized protein n=1 Tax=Natrarchaeobaculum sulfurireducens TaxID=2044521 RepID=A0A346PJP7_9EURY|nr:hypothetical protein AArc1_3449 [Natrarchaeobaculum sulfurireducens]AXR83481.1 hypothetical protein AArcMg_3507 [Natrarchaeobaculum sulfurireducens]